MQYIGVEKQYLKYLRNKMKNGRLDWYKKKENEVSYPLLLGFIKGSYIS